jgi:hypothetical protein
MSWSITYRDLIGPNITNAHFHGPAPAGTDTGVQIQQLTPFTANPLTGTATLTAAQETMLLGGLMYYNIHTDFDASGEIRGQVVPEPALIGLLSIGALGLLARRRRA